jgi:hypothetical protein
LALVLVMSPTLGLIPYIKWLKIGTSIRSRVLNLTLRLYNLIWMKLGLQIAQNPIWTCI